MPRVLLTLNQVAEIEGIDREDPTSLSGTGHRRLAAEARRRGYRKVRGLEREGTEWAWVAPERAPD